MRCLSQTICLTRSSAGDDARWRAVGNGVCLGGCGGTAVFSSRGRSEDDCDEVEVESTAFTAGSTAVLVVLDVDLNEAVLVELGSFQSRGDGFSYGDGCGLQSINLRNFVIFKKPDTCLYRRKNLRYNGTGLDSLLLIFQGEEDGLFFDTTTTTAS